MSGFQFADAPPPFLLAIPPFFTRAQVEYVGYGLHIFVSC